MAVKIGSARIDENGHISGGKAGDQTGKEICTQDFYTHSKGWVCLRCADKAKREIIAQTAQDICDNDFIGYSQTDRESGIKEAKSVNYNIAKIKKRCDLDCSSLVRLCVLAAGIDVDNFNTESERKTLKTTGYFKIKEGTAYSNTSDYLRRGDILVTKTKGHTVVVLDDGLEYKKKLAENNNTMRGVDISHWNNVDVKKLSCDFVIIKATQGTSYIDPTFEKQAKAIINCGKLLGIYHYYGGGTPTAEADHFIKYAMPYVDKAIMILDWERGDNKKFADGQETALKFLKRVKNKLGVTPFIYMSKSVCREYKWDKVAGIYPLWCAQYANDKTMSWSVEPWTDNKGFGAFKGCEIFQYTETGRVSGYSGNLDLNIAYFNKSKWLAYAGAKTETKDVVDSKTKEEEKNNDKIVKLVYNTMRGTYGDGEQRKKKLGADYDAVQNMINHIATATTAKLARETKQGMYGNGEFRQTVLGNRYKEVQNKINNG